MKAAIQLYPFRWVGQNTHDICHHKKKTAQANDPDSTTASTKHQRIRAATLASVSVSKTLACVCGVEYVGYWRMIAAAIAKGRPLCAFA